MSIAETTTETPRPSSELAPLDEAVIRRHAPLLWLHPRERTTPSDPAAFLACRNAEHHDHRGKPSWWKFIGAPRTKHLGTADALMAGVVSAGAVEGRLVLGRQHDRDPSGTTRSPLLAEVTYLPSGDVALTYWFFWADNHAAPRWPRNALMSHEGDWERIVLRLSGATLEPEMVAFHAHGGYQERAWQGLERRGDRPVAWAALGSHACYSKPGWQFPRLFDFAARSHDDATLFDPLSGGVPIVRVEDAPWYRIGVRWGDGPRSRFRSGPSPFGPGNRTGCPAAWFDDVPRR